MIQAEHIQALTNEATSLTDRDINQAFSKFNERFEQAGESKKKTILIGNFFLKKEEEEEKNGLISNAGEKKENKSQTTFT